MNETNINTILISIDVLVALIKTQSAFISFKMMCPAGHKLIRAVAQLSDSASQPLQLAFVRFARILYTCRPADPKWINFVQTQPLLDNVIKILKNNNNKDNLIQSAILQLLSGFVGVILGLNDHRSLILNLSKLGQTELIRMSVVRHRATLEDIRLSDVGKKLIFAYDNKTEYEESQKLADTKPSDSQLEETTIK